MHQPDRLSLSNIPNGPLEGIIKLNGRTLSKGKILDIQRGKSVVSLFNPQANIVGVVLQNRIPAAIALGAYTTDVLIQIYSNNSKDNLAGGTFITNGELDTTAAAWMVSSIVDVQFQQIAAQKIDQNSRYIVLSKQPNVGLYHVENFTQQPSAIERVLSSKKNVVSSPFQVDQIDSNLEDLGLGALWTMRPNAAVVVARYSPVTLAMVSDNMSRIDATQKAFDLAGRQGGILINDGPIPHSLMQRAKAEGIRRIILPGSEEEMQELITEAERHKIGLTLVNNGLF
jgi:AICAR transformylase/IMP cyclohydrolase PurH